MTSEGDIVSHVNISSLAISDGGTYICTANNTIGSAQQPQQLNIYGEQVIFYCNTLNVLNLKSAFRQNKF